MSELDRLAAMVETLEKKQDGTNQAIEHLTDRIGELVIVLTKKEVNDEHAKQRADKLETAVESLELRVRNLETAQAGDRAGVKVVQWVVPLVISLVIAFGGQLLGLVSSDGE